MEIKKLQIKSYPEPTVGVIIYNDQREILLIRSRKWGDYWHIPGGHIEIGETAETALRREVKEETGLDIDKIEFIGWVEAIYPKAYYKKKHFIFLDFRARLAGGEISLSDEMEQYIWIKPNEGLKKLKIAEYTVQTIQVYLKHQGGKEDNYHDKYKRALADYQNLLKQTAKEKSQFARFANEQLLLEILPVYDNLKMALEHAGGQTAGNGWLEGINHVIRQFKDILNSIGIEEIETAGQKFNHHTMEALEGRGEKVKQQIKAGYKLHGKVIVPAKVILE